ncbi:MAG: efflux RND transporter periplasmic adaptor subunit [Pseudomonadota bacterium]
MRTQFAVPIERLLKYSSLLFLCLTAIAVPTLAQDATVVAPVVETAVAKRSPIREFEFAQGTVHATRREFLVFESSGKVSYVKTNAEGFPIREGEPVREGQLLASLENDTESASIQSAQASLDAARAGLRSAQSSYQRAENLKAGGAISERDYDRAVTSLEQSRARVEAAETSLIRSTTNVRGSQLIAPFDGVVAFINIREGQYVSPTSFNNNSDAAAIRTAPLVLIDPGSFEIVVDVPSFVGQRLSLGQAAFVIRQEALASLQTVGVEAPEQLVSHLIPGDIVSVSPAINPEDRSIRTRILLQNAAPNLRDGEHVTVWLQVGRKDAAIVVPTTAILKRSGQPYVFVVDATNRARQRDITLGLVGLEGVEIVSGVSPGDRVVTRGKNRARDGEPVIASSNESGDQ